MTLFTNVPVRPLSRMNIGDYAEHLKALGQEDRRFRFCNALSDEGIDLYVRTVAQRMRDKDEVFASYSVEGKMLGAAHVSVDHDSSGQQFAEVGISVLPEGREHGIARALMLRAILHAGNLGCDRIETVCLMTNERMESLARSVGMRVKSDLVEQEKRAELPLEKPTMHSLGFETALSQASLWDEAISLNAEYGRRIIGAFAERFVFPLPFGDWTHEPANPAES